jgi:hypothetical protein
MKNLSNKELIHSPNETIVFACIRNEVIRLPYFIDYHKKLGIKKFVFVDNNSNDGSTNYLLKRDDCFVFWTDDDYSSSRCGIDWLNVLLNRFSLNRWALILDADELLIYPKCEKNNINQLTNILDKKQANALQTFMLDMYAKGPLKNADYIRGQSFIETCPYFDVNSYQKLLNSNNQLIPHRGGPRKRLFWLENSNQIGNPPVLNKIPLIKWQEEFALEASTHILKNAQFSKFTGVLLHFKFFSDFYHLAKKESEREQHWDNGAQYKAYWKIIEQQPNLDPFYEGSIKYRNSDQLIDLGLMYNDF